ncbi:MAG: tRNA lysidine(34) synthetase TilS [Candidatus Sumerlaeia bacterium]|nr:tRNA lysidine(34) synthetase TilS [Candidatus Sumerlaeia bacterium]
MPRPSKHERIPFIVKVEATIRRYGLMTRGQAVGVAVSGGADSVALLAALAEIAPRWQWRLTVLHVNHTLRGRESGGDQRFVRQLAGRLGLPCRIRHLGRDAMYRAIIRRFGPRESFLREQRYRAFEALAKAEGIATVALAHHRDDQAETVLMHLLRGSGPAGMGGFLPRQTIGGVTYVRPLYECAHAEICDFLRRRGLKWREDRSNSDPRWLRNRIRHELLPLLEREYNPNLRTLLADNARWFQEDEAYFTRRALDVLQMKSAAARPPQAVALKTLRGLEPPVLARLFRLWVAAVADCDHPPSGRQIEELIGLVRRPSPRACVRCAEGVEFFVDGDFVRWWSPALGATVIRERKSGAGETDDIAGPPQCALKEPVELPPEGKCDIAAGDLSSGPRKLSHLTVAIRRIKRQRQPALFRRAMEQALRATNAENLIQYFDADRIAEPLVLRNRRPGDRMHPLGAPGSRKLKEFLIDEKVPIGQRDRLLLLCDRRQILWVVGLRTSHEARLTRRTKNILCVRLRPVRATASHSRRGRPAAG